MSRRGIVIVLTVGALAALAALGLLLVPASAAPEERASGWEHEFYEPLFWAVQEIKLKYVDEVDPQVLLRGALEGMTNRLDDYSTYIPPKRYQEFQDDTKGEFGGLGIHIRFLDIEKAVRVEQVMPGTPAFRAGVLPEDLILRIREESTGAVVETHTFQDVHDAVRVLRGEPGAKVTLTLVRKESGKMRQMTIKREVIKVPSVRGVRIVDSESGIGYLYLDGFNEHTVADLLAAVRDLRKQGMKALIIDLRFNPGGLLRTSVRVSDMFLTEGVVVSTRGRTSGQEVYEASRGELVPDMPIVLLVNRYSASASEIVSAALKDHQRAILVGETTYGKGSVQTVLENAERRDGLKLTTSRYYSPAGVCIDKIGVKPHLEIKLSQEDLVALAASLGNLGDYPEDEGGEPALKAPTEVPEELQDFQDVQLQRAIDVLGSMVAREGAPIAASAAAP